MVIRTNADGSVHKPITLLMSVELYQQLGLAATTRKLYMSEVVRRLIRLLLDGQIDVR